MRHIIPVSGKDSLCTAIVQLAADGSLPYEYVWTGTGLELSPLEQWLQRVESSLGISVRRTNGDLRNRIYEEGILPSPRARYCTRVSKIYPFMDFVGADEAALYLGLRADEPDRGGYVAPSKGNGSGVVVRYPLKALGLGISQVWDIVSTRNLLPPAFTWESVENRVKDELQAMGALPALDKLSDWEKRSLFSWRSRELNCGLCIYGRQYEIVGLAEHYPEEFEWYVKAESEVGAESYTWRQGYTLRELVKKKEIVIERRVREVVTAILGKSQLSLWEGEEFIAPIEVTSCGLWCGK